MLPRGYILQRNAEGGTLDQRDGERFGWIRFGDDSDS
jgi:hypothetical protein